MALPQPGTPNNILFMSGLFFFSREGAAHLRLDSEHREKTCGSLRYHHQLGLSDSREIEGARGKRCDMVETFALIVLKLSERYREVVVLCAVTRELTNTVPQECPRQVNTADPEMVLCST